MKQTLYKNKYRTDFIRLKGWDYTQNGMYFITICTNYNENIFGKIEEGKMVLNNLGEIAQKYLYEIPDHFSNAILDAYIIMPDHVHAVIIIDKHVVGTQHCYVPTKTTISNTFYRLKPRSLSVIIRSYKSICSKMIHKTQNNKLFKWQSSFYDRIIYNDESLKIVRQYIVNNPQDYKKIT